MKTNLKFILLALMTFSVSVGVGYAGNSGAFDNPPVMFEETHNNSFSVPFINSAHAQEAEDGTAELEKKVSEIIAEYDCAEGQAIAVQIAQAIEAAPAKGSSAESWVSWITGLAAVIGGAVTYVIQLVVNRRKAAAG